MTEHNPPAPTADDFRAFDAGNRAAKKKVDDYVTARVKADRSRNYGDHMLLARMLAFKIAPANQRQTTAQPPARRGNTVAPARAVAPVVPIRPAVADGDFTVGAKRPQTSTPDLDQFDGIVAEMILIASGRGGDKGKTYTALHNFSTTHPLPPGASIRMQNAANDGCVERVKAIAAGARDSLARRRTPPEAA
jgi:hypothetical protein